MVGKIVSAAGRVLARCPAQSQLKRAQHLACARCQVKEASHLMVIAKADDAMAMSTDTGTELRVLLDTTRAGQGRLSLAMETLGPGQHTVPHWHAHLEEIYYIVTGAGRMEIGTETCEVRAGDAILIPLYLTHCLHNTGDSDLVLLCPVSPPWYADDFRVEEGTHD